MKVDIKYNDKRNGIELRFETQPEKDVTKLLNSVGFKFSYPQKMWYAIKDKQKEDVANQIKTILESDGDISSLKLAASYEPSDENIDHNNFSYVSLYFNIDGKPKWKNYVLFEPSKKLAELLATQYAEKKYGEDIISVNVYPRNYKRKARKLFDAGDVLLLEENTEQKKTSVNNSEEALTKKRKLEILTEFGKFHEKRRAEFPEVAIERSKQLHFYAWLRANYPKLLSQKESIWKEYDTVQNSLDDKGVVEPITEKHEKNISSTDEGGNTKTIKEETKPKENLEDGTEDLVDTPHSQPKKAKPSKKKTQHEINKEIEDFIDNKHNEDQVYQDDILNFLSQYTGSGGLIKQGAEGKGILYEYFTSDEIVKKMWGLVVKYGYTDGGVLEPSCGIGNFIKYAPKSAKVVGYETNRYSSKIAEILYPQAIIYNQSFETNFFSGNIHLKDDFGGAKYDLVIGNPPYGTFSGKYAGMGEKKFTGAIEYDQYFITRGLDLLRENGLLSYIIPSSFLSNASKYNNIKEKIQVKADLIDAYRLPQRAFKTTDIGTDIIVFKKK